MEKTLDQIEEPLKSHAGLFSKADKLVDLFGSKHVVLSYQWDIQDLVVNAREQLKARGVPTWMDIDGGMKADIYDSCVHVHYLFFLFVLPVTT